MGEITDRGGWRILRFEERGNNDAPWARIRPAFHFHSAFDAPGKGFRALIEVVDDLIEPGYGFGMHRHQEQEIITYIISGQLRHSDSLQHTEILRPGDVQRVTAGTGLAHAEWNASETEREHNLQIVVRPIKSGAKPGYEQRTFDKAQQTTPLALLVSPDGRDGSLTINADLLLWRILLKATEEASALIRPGHGAWLNVVAGSLVLDGYTLRAGDAAALDSGREIKLNANEAVEAILVDVA